VLSTFHIFGPHLKYCVFRVFFNQDVFEPGAEAASMDSSGLWMFEKSDPSWGGDNVEPGIYYRIKHATTGLVLIEAAVKSHILSGCLMSCVMSGWFTHHD
jgi:hypothetical protein